MTKNNTIIFYSMVVDGKFIVEKSYKYIYGCSKL